MSWPHENFKEQIEVFWRTSKGSRTGWKFTKFIRFFVALGLNILRLFRLKVLFEANIIKGWC